MRLVLGVMTAVLLTSSANAIELDVQRSQRSTVPSSSVEWTAFAATPGGRVFQSDGVFRSEEDARRNARSNCENTTARTCESTISVPLHFDVVFMRCENGNRNWVFFGASALDQEDDGALSKARNNGYYNCRVLGRY